MTGGGVQGDRASWRGCQSPDPKQMKAITSNRIRPPQTCQIRRICLFLGGARAHVSAAGSVHINLPFIPPKCPHYMSVTSERLRQTSRSRPIFAPCHFLRLLLLIPAGEIRRSGASVIAPRAHRGVLSHTEIHISASFNLGCGSLAHIYDCS